jgi:hypothetical protein
MTEDIDSVDDDIAGEPGGRRTTLHRLHNACTFNLFGGE